MPTSLSCFKVTSPVRTNALQRKRGGVTRTCFLWVQKEIDSNSGSCFTLFVLWRVPFSSDAALPAFPPRIKPSVSSTSRRTDAWIDATFGLRSPGDAFKSEASSALFFRADQLWWKKGMMGDCSNILVRCVACLWNERASVWKTNG